MGLEPRPNLGSRLRQPPQTRQGGGKIKVRQWISSVGFNRTPQPTDCLLLFAEMKIGYSGDKVPVVNERIARTEAQRLADVILGFLEPTRESSWPLQLFHARKANFYPVLAHARIPPCPEQLCW